MSRRTQSDWQKIVDFLKKFHTTFLQYTCPIVSANQFTCDFDFERFKFEQYGSDKIV